MFTAQQCKEEENNILAKNSVIMRHAACFHCIKPYFYRMMIDVLCLHVMKFNRHTI